MRSYEFIAHTAEAGIRLEADSLQELFRAGLEGVAEWLKPALDRVVDVRAPISVDAAMPETVLVDFLVDTLTRSQVERAVFFDAEFVKLEAQRVEATLLGRRVGEFDDDIKAITYHGAGIREPEPGRYETEVIFDI